MLGSMVRDLVGAGDGLGGGRDPAIALVADILGGGEEEGMCFAVDMEIASRVFQYGVDRVSFSLRRST